MKGYIGTILKINLSTKSIEEETLQENVAKKYRCKKYSMLRICGAWTHLRQRRN